MALSLALGGGSEAARVHFVNRWCGGVAAHSARAAASDAGRGLSQQPITRGVPQVLLRLFAKGYAKRDLLRDRISGSRSVGLKAVTTDCRLWLPNS